MMASMEILRLIHSRVAARAAFAAAIWFAGAFASPAQEQRPDLVYVFEAGKGVASAAST